MQMLRTIAGALALALSIATASAQTNPGTSPLSVPKGGTGAATASGARTNLGVAIGSNVQAWDADLDALAALSGTSTIYYRSGANTWTAVTIGGLLSFTAGTLNVGDAELTALGGLTSANNKCFYFTGSGTASTFDCSSFGRSVANAADASALRTLAGTVIGTDVQAQDAELAAIAGLTSAANKLPYFTGSGTAALADFSAAVRTWFTTSSSANLASILTDETGSGAAVFGTAPTISAPVFTGLVDNQGAHKDSTQSAPSQITSNQNNYNPSSVVCASTTTLLINSDAARDITGIAGGVAGCDLFLVNNGSFSITLKEENASSTAGNRFTFGGDFVLASKSAAHLKYDGTASRWRNTTGTGSGGSGVTQIIAGDGLNGGTITTSGTIALSGKPYMEVVRTTDQTSIGSGFVKVQFNSATVDSGSYWDAVTNFRYTPLVAGRYHFSWTIDVNSTFTAGAVIADALYKNGSAVCQGAQAVAASSVTTDFTVTGSCDVALNGSTDYIEVFGLAGGSGQSFKCSNGASACKLTGHFIGQ